MLQLLTRSPALFGAFALFLACSSDNGSPTATPDVAADSADTSADGTSDVPDDAPGSSACNPDPATCGEPGEGPPRLSEHGAAYISAAQRMIVFGGTTGVPENCDPAVAAAYVADTWLFDDGCGVWEQSTANGPSARGRHSMAASAADAWVFGGRWRPDGATSGDYTFYDELWHYDIVDDSWTLAASGGPSPRVNASLVWDSTAERLILFGGNESTSGMNLAPLNDAWEFDPSSATWTELAPLGTPPEPRLAAAGLFDPVRNRMIVFGGFDSFNFGGGVEYFSDVWALNLGTMAWEQLANEVGAPDGRFGATLIYDETFDHYVLFGGHDDQQLGNRNDVWLFFPEQANWATLAAGDVFNSPQIDFCEFPPDFTTIDPALPERRNYHTFVWSSCERGLVFGGKTDCGSANDVWSYADESWEELWTATSGEVCVRFRSNPDNCVNLCF